MQTLNLRNRHWQLFISLSLYFPFIFCLENVKKALRNNEMGLAALFLYSLAKFKKKTQHIANQINTQLFLRINFVNAVKLDI